MFFSSNLLDKALFGSSSHLALTSIMIGLVLGDFELAIDINGLDTLRAFKMLRMPGFVHCSDALGFDSFGTFGTPGEKYINLIVEESCSSFEGLRPECLKAISWNRWGTLGLEPSQSQTSDRFYCWRKTTWLIWENTASGETLLNSPSQAILVWLR